MSRHVRRIQDQVFEIEVKSLSVSAFDAPMQMFVAKVCRVADGEPASAQTFERHEIYGPTEDWAVRNACASIAAELSGHVHV